MIKKIVLASAIVTGMGSTAFAQDSGSSFYIGGAYVHSLTEIDTGGLNTAGGFINFDCSGTTIGALTCDDTDNAAGGSIFFGINKIVSFSDAVSLRGEVEYNYQGGSDYVTGSFPGAPTPLFVYATSTGSHHTGFVNTYLDLNVPDMPVTLYVGGGIGVSRSKVSTNDTVVAGSASDTSFAYNVGGGVKFEVLNNFELFGDVRYVDLGSTDVPLIAGAAGNYTADHQSTQFRLGLIYKFGNGFSPFSN